MSYEFKSKFANPHFEAVFDVTPQEVKDFASELTLIDVRQPEEYTGELGHIAGSQLIVLNELPDKLNTIPKDKPIVFICRSGMRSAQACQYAHSKGFSQTFNMLGGMLAWNQLAFPTINN